MTGNVRPRVVIIGAGFGGLWAARALGNKKVEVLLLDRNNYHTFLPLLYQVATAELAPEDIVYPVRSILRKSPNIRFLMGEVTEIDFVSRLVRTSEYEFPYDFLILATGSTSHFFGVTGAIEYVFQLKTLEQAIVLRNQILCNFERALCEAGAERRQNILTFAIVGGGPTGVEFAGALAELVRGPLVKDFPTLDFREVRILLLEATDRLLPSLPEPLQTYAQARLHHMGVEVHLQATISQVTPLAVHFKDGRVIPAGTVIWTAGVRGEVPFHKDQIPEARNERLEVMPTLQVPGHPDVYVVGDLAHVAEDGNPLPLIAPVAIQEAETAAENIIRQIEGLEPLPFHYHDPGTMVTIGRNAAVVQIKGHSFTGFLAWILWLGVHLFNLIGFRNRLQVMINWAWDYIFFERAMRLIVPLPKER